MSQSDRNECVRKVESKIKPKEVKLLQKEREICVNER